MDISENYILYPRLYKNVKYRKNVEISKKIKKKINKIIISIRKKNTSLSNQSRDQCHAKGKKLRKEGN